MENLAFSFLDISHFSMQKIEKKEGKYLFCLNRFSLTQFSPLLSIRKKGTKRKRKCFKHVDDDVETLKRYTPCEGNKPWYWNGIFLCHFPYMEKSWTMNMFKYLLPFASFCVKNFALPSWNFDGILMNEVSQDDLRAMQHLNFDIDWKTAGLSMFKLIYTKAGWKYLHLDFV